MTTYTLPGDKNIPNNLGSGDILNVNAGGTSHNITLLNGAIENVNKGGSADHTTVNDGGRLIINGGTTVWLTINEGDVTFLGGVWPTTQGSMPPAAYLRSVRVLWLTTRSFKTAHYTSI
jgi:autotransporter passenger strand-loop-strand repeat protein